jgi:hypothetical protein
MRGTPWLRRILSHTLWQISGSRQRQNYNSITVLFLPRWENPHKQFETQWNLHVSLRNGGAIILKLAKPPRVLQGFGGLSPAINAAKSLSSSLRQPGLGIKIETVTVKRTKSVSLEELWEYEAGHPVVFAAPRALAEARLISDLGRTKGNRRRNGAFHNSARRKLTAP